MIDRIGGTWFLLGGLVEWLAVRADPTGGACIDRAGEAARSIHPLMLLCETNILRSIRIDEVGAMHSQSIDVDLRPNAIEMLIENDSRGMRRPYDCHARSLL
jgi:hypothetical protein